MGLVNFISEQRERHVIARARPHLVDGERVLRWARARHLETGRRGIFFITSQHALVTWAGESERIRWEEVRAWGVDRHADGGPVVRIDSRRRGRTSVQVVVRTQNMARAAGEFIRHFGELAPRSASRDPEEQNGSTPGAKVVGGELPLRRRTPGDLARRIALTVVGAGLMVVGIAIIPLPGPWSFMLSIAGLAVLAREYDWADDLLGWTKERFESAKNRIRKRRSAE